MSHVYIFAVTCLTHQVNVNNFGKFRLTQGFLDALLGLESVCNATSSEQKEEFKNFINQFGTHFSDVTQLGATIYMETRYTASGRMIK